MIEPGGVIIGLSFFACVALTVRTIGGVWMKRLDVRRPSALPDGAEQRLERIEAAVDAIAVEIERIAEAQRFAARLSVGRTPDALPASFADPVGEVVARR